MAIGLHQQMAMMVLELRLSGATSREAIRQTAAAAGNRDKRVISHAWAKHGRDALVELRLGRAASGKQWTSQELSRLEEAVFPQGGVVYTCPECGVRKFAENCDATCPACGWHPPLCLSEGPIDEQH